MACVHSLLLQNYGGNKAAARLLHALSELAGRVEAADRAGPRSAGARSNAKDAPHPSDVQLPDPATGPLPLLPCACEHEALQAAAEHSSLQLRSTSEREAWRSWLMSPPHVVRVVEAAWLLLALVFRREDACAAGVQEHVFKQLQQHCVTVVLSGREPVAGAGALWCGATADAACRLLRSAFPGAAELQDPQLQQLLHRQLRLFITGLLPSDAAAPCLLPAPAQAEAGASTDIQPVGDDTSTNMDPWAAQGAASSSSGNNSSGDGAGGCADDAHRGPHGGAQELGKASRRVAAFVAVKPSPAINAFMAQQGMRPAADLLQPPAGGAVTRVTLPLSLVQQQQQHQQQPAGPLPAEQHGKQHHQQRQQGAAADIGGGDHVNSCSSSHRARAAACLQVGLDAADAYARRKQATAASVRGAGAALRQQAQQLVVQREQAMAAGASQARELSNKVSGWLSESGAEVVSYAAPSRSSTVLSAGTGGGGGGGVTHAPTTPTRASSLGGGGCKGGPGSCSRGAVRMAAHARSTKAGGDGGGAGRHQRSPPPATDLHCKAQRQALEGQLRAADWRLARSLNPVLHDRCTNLAAALAATPAAAAAAAAGAAPPLLELKQPVGRGGQDWGALISSGVVRSRVRGARGGRAGGAGGCGAAGAAAAAAGLQGPRSGGSDGSSIKVTKAARAIVEEVQRACAAPGGSACVPRALRRRH